MKSKRWLVFALIVILLLAIVFVWLSSDPGFVLIHFRGWRIEATVVGAVGILIACWIAIGIVWWLLLWPFGALSRRRRRFFMLRNIPAVLHTMALHDEQRDRLLIAQGTDAEELKQVAATTGWAVPDVPLNLPQIRA